VVLVVPRIDRSSVHFLAATLLICEFLRHMDSFTYISVLLSIVLGLAITQVLLGAPRSHIDQGKSEVVYPDSDMGGSRSPHSDSSVVGKLRNARATQMDIFGAPRNHAGND
jgi:hypothetical protein